MNITVKEELRAYIDPLTTEEHEALERSILAEGCRDALVLWGDVLVDGHNRHGICQKHGLAFQTVQNTRFKSMDDVHLWMIDQHLGRRSVSDFQRGVLALRKKDILAAQNQASPALSTADATEAAEHAAIKPAEPLTTREALAKAARISSNTVSQIEKIQKAAVPELVAAVKSGEISINAAAAVASLPQDAQIAAVAGGRKELQQAARQVREAKATKRTSVVAPDARQAPENGPATDAPWDDDLATQVVRMKQTIKDLTAENAELTAQVARLTAQTLSLRTG
ncbi:MAG: hypothetical protein KGL90_03455 [Burkholderiales bacterium]|nr:hypothetical protein [Burkholderiales bacterium]